MSRTRNRIKLLVWLRVSTASALLLAVMATQENVHAAFRPCRDPEFAPAANYPIGASPFGLKAADLDGDGRPDLVMPVGLSGVAVLMNTGNGHFGTAAVYSTGGRASAIAIGDFNHDARPDLIVANVQQDASEPPSGVVLLLNLGGGVLGSPIPVLSQPYPWSVAVGDLNGDGNMDVVVGTQSPAHPPTPVYIIFGNGAGGFGPPHARWVGNMSPYVALGDFNEDGVLDLAVGTSGVNASDDRLVVLLGTGNGSFVTRWSTPTPLSPWGLFITDINKDGHLDIGTVIDQDNVSSVNFLFFGTGTGAFFGGNIGGSPGMESMAAADVTGDGYAEIANPIDEITGEVVVQLSPTRDINAQANAHHYAVQSGPIALVMEDVDGDGRKDIAVANRDSASVSILLNTCDGPVAGGQGLTLTSGGSGIPDQPHLKWWRGDKQAGYLVVRRVGTNSTVLTVPPLSRDSTVFIDTAPVAGQQNCYFVEPISAIHTVLGVSDMLCVQPNSGGGDQFSIALNQSNTVTMPSIPIVPWLMPWEQLNPYPLDGSTPLSPEFGLYTTREDTRGIPTCLSRVWGSGTATYGVSDIFCAVPGVSTLGTQ